jgi:GntR family transcriptional regulator/MocR family aminotransferase
LGIQRRSAAHDGVTRVSLARQIADRLRTAVLQGQLGPGARVASTRQLAAESGVSRNTVLEAYAQLLSEGYLEARRGSATRVSRALPEATRLLRSPPRPVSRPRTLRSGLSPRGRRIVAAYASVSDDYLRPFTPGIPALDPDGLDAWWRVARRTGRMLTSDTLNYGPAAGYLPLREAIAAHIGPARGVRCTTDQVIVTAGSQPALALAARLLLEPGDEAWIEDPGYVGARGALLAAGARLIPVPVDDDGLVVDSALRRAAQVRMAYVSPSHQYPLGVTLSLPRRLQLLEWAARSNTWILEDDYDAEFRYAGRPVPSMQGLDREGRVLYVGTFSKSLFPALRLGFIVVPTDLVDAFVGAIAVGGYRAPTIDQAVLTNFIADGHFFRHLRRLRRRYQEARLMLEKEVERLLGATLTISGAPIGMHVIGRLAKGTDDRRVSRKAEAIGVCAPPLSDYALNRSRVSGLVLGYGHLSDRAIREGVERLARAIGGRPTEAAPYGHR